MYTIELDVDPVTLGFDPKEVTRKEDGTYVVTRRFVHVQHSNMIGRGYDIEAYCPCLTDNVEIYCYEMMDHKGRMTYGANYVTNNGEHYTYDRRSLNNSMMDFWHPLGPGVFNKKYDTHIEKMSQQERNCSICVSKVNGNPSNLQSSQKSDFEQYQIVYGRSAPTNPYDDPFLPEKFKQMLNAANAGEKA